jgi:two-component system response regulator FixJ
MTSRIERAIGIPVETANERLALLTARELEVADAFANGLTSRRIGEQLGISPKTVDIHRGNIKIKLQAKTTVDVVRYVLLKRIVDSIRRGGKRAARRD